MKDASHQMKVPLRRDTPPSFKMTAAENAFRTEKFYEVFAVSRQDDSLKSFARSSSNPDSVTLNNANPLRPSILDTHTGSSNDSDSIPSNVNPHSPTEAMAQSSISLSDPSLLIFSPPNTVPVERRLITQPNPSTYVAPVKVAGDVSLNGFQLVSFLTKASLRLREGATQEGVQVLLYKLYESVSKNTLSEACLKKLNYIVDEIDRELYHEAWGDLEQFIQTYPSEAAGWSQGVRIMLIELRRTAQKLHGIRTNSFTN